METQREEGRAGRGRGNPQPRGQRPAGGEGSGGAGPHRPHGRKGEWGEERGKAGQGRARPAAALRPEPRRTRKGRREAARAPPALTPRRCGQRRPGRSLRSSSAAGGAATPRAPRGRSQLHHWPLRAHRPAPPLGAFSLGVRDVTPRRVSARPGADRERRGGRGRGRPGDGTWPGAQRRCGGGAERGGGSGGRGGMKPQRGCPGAAPGAPATDPARQPPPELPRALQVRGETRNLSRGGCHGDGGGSRTGLSSLTAAVPAPQPARGAPCGSVTRGSGGRGGGGRRSSAGRQSSGDTADTRAARGHASRRCGRPSSRRPGAEPLPRKVRSALRARAGPGRLCPPGPAATATVTSGREGGSAAAGGGSPGGSGALSGKVALDWRGAFRLARRGARWRRTGWAWRRP